MFKKLLFFLIPVSTFAQTEISLNDLSAFKNPSDAWSVQGGVSGSPFESTLKSIAGKGMLLNQLKGAKYLSKDDLIFNLEHGDIRLSLDFMIPQGSNSGIYLQGQYEVQILDSWLRKNPISGDCGGIYHRWDESRGKGNEGYQGHAPLQNAVKAPGLWNHIEIDFKAPKFDVSGKKIANARFEKVVMNGVLIHENVELLGVTRGALTQTEIAKGPLRIQGNHGWVAFKNIKYEVFDKPLLQFSKINYSYFEGTFPNLNTGSTKAIRTGTADQPSAKLAEAKYNFLLKSEGKLNIPETDTYTFTTHWTGSGALLIDNDTLTNGASWATNGVRSNKKLSAGEHSYTLIYTKDFPWAAKALGLFVARIGTETQAITERTSLPDPDPEPLVEVKTNGESVTQRSFMMYKNKKKTHVISVGTNDGLNFSYDLNQGAMLHLWRGKFLNTTEMWFERGEPQLGKPMGVVATLNGKFPLAFLANENESFPDSIAKDDLKYKGYRLDNLSNPNFSFEYKSLKIKDLCLPIEKSYGLVRSIKIEGDVKSGGNLYALLAEGTEITDLGENRFAIDNNSYYVQVFSDGKSKPIIKINKGIKQLIIPVTTNEVSYNLIF